MSTVWAIGASVRALSQSLVRAGHRVIAADLFGDIDLQRSAVQTRRIVDYPRELLSLVPSADAFVYTGGLENEPELIDQLCSKLPLWGNPGSVLRRVRDVLLLRNTLQRGGFEMPQISHQPPQIHPQRWLIKSAHSSGGLRVSWVDSRPRSLGTGEYYQAFVDGSAYGASFYGADGDVTLLGIARQLTECAWTRRPQFCYAGSIGPIVVPTALCAEVTRLGELVASEFGLRGWFGIDFISGSHNKLSVLEINPRYTASMELLDRCTPSLAAKAILYTERNVYLGCEFVERLLRRNDVADIPNAQTEINAGSPVCSLFADGQSEDAVLAALHEKGQVLAAEIANLPETCRCQRP